MPRWSLWYRGRGSDYGLVLVKVLAGSLALLCRDMKARSGRGYGQYGVDAQNDRSSICGYCAIVGGY